MTVTIPNYLIEKKEPTLMQLDDNLYIERMHSHTGKVLVRNTMHGLTLIQSGHKEVQMNGRNFKIEKDHAIFFAQGNYFTNRNSNDYRSLTFFFDDRYIIEFLKKYSIHPHCKAHHIKVVNYAKHDHVSPFLDSIISTLHQKKAYHSALLKLKFELLLLEFYHSFTAQMDTFFQHILQTSKERMRYILEENIDILYTVRDMQQLMRMSPSQFHRQFQKHFRETPKTWIDKKRMEKARFLLATTDKSITQIACDCGYSTASWFIVQFKKYCKSTPKQYREENRYK
ncbi:AraC family transcriptional regulator [Sulfurovum sp.]|uniref:helix-turn-helix transcriptional regulator n=1 Tax=Sulfurovum sp. TaxID=1969726 RepID=UPI0025DCDB59|nr:AraC family transcriptional regulator [Sulfurovum sp.]